MARTPPVGDESSIVGDGPSGGRLSREVGGRNRGRVVVLLAAVLGLSAADSGAIGALAAPLERSFHIGNTRLGLLVTVTTLVAAAATLPFGALADRCNRTRILRFALVTWGVATAVSALAVSYAMFLATRVALGVLLAAASPLVVSLAGDLFPANERGRLFGLVLSGELVGGGIGIVVAGTLSGLAGWRAAIAVLAFPAFLLVWAFRRYFPEPARGGEGIGQGPGSDSSGGDAAASMVLDMAEARGVTAPGDRDLSGPAPAGLWAAVRTILRVRTNIALIVASGLGYFFLQGVETFAELFFRDRYGVGQSLASIMFIFFALSSIIGVLAGGRIADRLIRRGHPSARLVVAAVAFVTAPVFFAPGVLTASLALSLPLLILAGAAIGAVNPPLDSARLDVMPPALWGRAEAVRTVFRSVLQGVAPVVFGLVSGAFGVGRRDRSRDQLCARRGLGSGWPWLGRHIRDPFHPPDPRRHGPRRQPAPLPR